MLWYVPLIRIANAAVYMGSEVYEIKFSKHQITVSVFVLDPQTSHLQVFRLQSRNKPAPGDQNVNWQETVCLNLILQQVNCLHFP